MLPIVYLSICIARRRFYVLQAQAVSKSNCLTFKSRSFGKICKMTFVQLRSVQQAQLNKVSKELVEIKDSTSVLRKRLAEMMNSLLSDLVSDCV